MFLNLLITFIGGIHLISFAVNWIPAFCFFLECHPKCIRNSHLYKKNYQSCLLFACHILHPSIPLPYLRNSVPSTISSKEDLASGCRNRDLGVMRIKGLRKGRAIWRRRMWNRLAGVEQLATWNINQHLMISYGCSADWLLLVQIG